MLRDHEKLEQLVSIPIASHHGIRDQNEDGLWKMKSCEKMVIVCRLSLAEQRHDGHLDALVSIATPGRKTNLHWTYIDILFDAT